MKFNPNKLMSSIASRVKGRAYTRSNGVYVPGECVREDAVPANVTYSRRGRPVNIDIDGIQFVPKKGVRFRDRTRPNQAAVAAEAATTLGAAAVAGTTGYNAGVVYGNTIKALESVANTARNLFPFLDGNDQNVMNSVQALVESGALQGQDLVTARHCLNNWIQYQSVEGMVDQTMADIDGAYAASVEPATRITPDLPHDVPSNAIVNMFNRLRGSYNDPEAHARNNLTVIRQKAKLYDVLEDTSKAIVQEVPKAAETGNTERAVRQMESFNKAWGNVLRENAMIEQGVENINPEAIATMQKAVDELGPVHLHWTDYLGPGLGAAAACVVAYLGRRVINRTNKAFDWVREYRLGRKK